MPIAKLITDVPELSEGIVRDLRARGFEVQMITPGQSIANAADLEITLDECRPEEYSQKAATFSADGSMCVVMPHKAIVEPVRRVHMLVLRAQEKETVNPASIALDLALTKASGAGVDEVAVETQNIDDGFPKDIWTMLAMLPPLTAEELNAAEIQQVQAIGAAEVVKQENVELQPEQISEAVAPRSPQIDSELVPSMFNLSAPFPNLQGHHRRGFPFCLLRFLSLARFCLHRFSLWHRRQHRYNHPAFNLRTGNQALFREAGPAFVFKAAAFDQKTKNQNIAPEPAGWDIRYGG